MTRFTFKLPDIGEGIADAEIVAWHVGVGDRVEEDQNLADMMTDKATVEMESPVSGVVLELAGAVGDQVAIGAALVVIETDSAAPLDDEARPIAHDASSRAGRAAETPASEKERSTTRDTAIAAFRPQPDADCMTVDDPNPEAGAALGPDRAGAASSAERGQSSGAAARALASSAVRQRATELGVDLAQVRSESGRVRHADLDAYLRYGAHQGYAAPGARPARPDEQVRVLGLRRRIAENMAASKRNIPHFTYVDEIDVTELERVRASLNDDRGQRPRLTVLPLLIVAICRTLPDFPMLNAHFDDEAGVVTRWGRVHLGMATQTVAGLTVPVIRDAQDRNVWQLAAEIARLAEAARANWIRPEEMGGSTITVTSLGPLGGIVTTPVINRPEVAIIGPNRIVERPVFEKNGTKGGEVRAAKLMNISISCDHRVVDGWDAASYVQALKHRLETPVLLLSPEPTAKWSAR